VRCAQEDGKLTDEEGEFSAGQFQKMMRGELKRYSQRRVQNAMSETQSKEFKAVLLGMKLLDLTQEKHENMLLKIMDKLGIAAEEEEEEEGEEEAGDGEGGEEGDGEDGNEEGGEEGAASAAVEVKADAVSPKWARQVEQKLAHVDAKLDQLGSKLDAAMAKAAPAASDPSEAGAGGGGPSGLQVAELNKRLDAIASLLAGVRGAVLRISRFRASAVFAVTGVT